MIKTNTQFTRIDPQTRRRITLGIRVDHQDAATSRSQISTQIDCGSRFGDPAFLIDKAVDFGCHPVVLSRLSSVVRLCIKRVCFHIGQNLFAAGNAGYPDLFYPK